MLRRKSRAKPRVGDCGAPFEMKPRQDIEEKEGELIELTPEEIAENASGVSKGDPERSQNSRRLRR